MALNLLKKIVRHFAQRLGISEVRRSETKANLGERQAQFLDSFNKSCLP